MNADCLPSGQVTFLFTDLEGSTALWDEYPDEMEAALEEHDRRMRAAVAAHNGYVFTTAGDSFAVSFQSASDALAAALDAQLSLREPCGPIAVKVRIGLHTGTASLRAGDYFGPAVNRAARLMSAAHGGQVVVSGSTGALVQGLLSPDVELVDRGEHRLKDLREPERVFEVRHPDLASSFPPLRTLDASENNLPIQVTELIGREKELAEVRELLRGHRLVTLTGSGGSGKTRLALHAAAESLEDHPAGVRLVELAALSDPAFVLDEIAQRVGARPAPETDVTSTIAARIGSLQMLLLLDNCEHVVETVAELVAPLLRACPQLRVLATSQVTLGVQGEFRYRVPSLALPETAAPDDARQSGAVRLFAERARAVSPDFEFDDDTLPHVVAICRRLDGIPLAIELAAARIRVLSPEQIGNRLDERFRLLGGGARDAAERQRTLRAAMDWSHELLSGDEQTLFRRSTTFAGGFDIDAAETVGTAPPITSFDVLDLTMSLVDKSFVATEHSSSGVRYRLPESIRVYGREKLDDVGEAIDTGARHAGHYVDVAESLYEQRRGGDLQGAIAGLERDEDNFRAALRFLLDHGDLDWAARILGSLGHLWYTTGAFREGIQWCRELFERDLDLPDEVHARVLHVYGALLGSWVGPREGAEILVEEVELRRRLGDPGGLAAALNNLGNLLSDIGRTDEAQRTLHEAIEFFHAAGEPASLAYASLGYDAMVAGRYEDAIDHCQRALGEATVHDRRYDAAVAQCFLAQSALHSGRLDEAGPLIQIARTEFEALGVRPGVAGAWLIEALLHLAHDETPEAAACLVTALSDPDSQWYESSAFWILQLAAGLTADPTRGARLIGAAKAQYGRAQEITPTWVQDHLEVTQARLEEQLGSSSFAAAESAGRALTREAAVHEGRSALADIRTG